jgi:beta-phosphoglucomutase family hydrolase
MRSDRCGDVVGNLDERSCGASAVADQHVPPGIGAVLFDLDGVLTQTAKVHAAAWTEVFDAFLADRGDPEPFRPSDYAAYVDGRLRQDGVREFLASRGISLPEGSADDPASADTVFGVGNRKNERFLRRLEQEGVERYEGSVRFLDAVRAAGLRTGVVSASRNCAAVLEAADLQDRFDVRVDGEVADDRGLRGKPAPDTFLAAADALGVPPAQAAVVEDAVAGVQAGRQGGFGWVVGVDRVGADQADQLRAQGADRVVRDLSELL